MEAETRKIMKRLNPNFEKFAAPVRALSGGQRQSVAIARAVYFNARILIMDEPTAALGVKETQMVAELIEQLKAEGLGIFLISHDIHDVMALCDRVSVMKNGKLVGTVRVEDVTEDDILGMIILGKQPAALAPVTSSAPRPARCAPPGFHTALKPGEQSFSANRRKTRQRNLARTARTLWPQWRPAAERRASSLALD